MTLLPVLKPVLRYPLSSPLAGGGGGGGPIDLPELPEGYAFVVDDNNHNAYIVDDNDHSIFAAEPV